MLYCFIPIPHGACSNAVLVPFIILYLGMSRNGRAAHKLSFSPWTQVTGEKENRLFHHLHISVSADDQFNGLVGHVGRLNEAGFGEI